MKTFYITGFKGYYPVGTSAIVTAETKKLAKQYLEKELKDMGLEQRIYDCDLTELQGQKSQVLVLCDGDY